MTYLSRDKITVRLRILAIGVDKYKLAPEAGGYKELRKAAEGARSGRRGVRPVTAGAFTAKCCRQGCSSMGTRAETTSWNALN